MRASLEGTRGGGDQVRNSLFGADDGESLTKIWWIAEELEVETAQQTKVGVGVGVGVVDFI